MNFWVVGAEPYPSYNWVRGGHTLGRSLHHHRATQRQTKVHFRVIMNDDCFYAEFELISKKRIDDYY